MPRLAIPAFSIMKDGKCHDIKSFDEKYPSLEIDNQFAKTRQRLFSYPMCNSMHYRTKNSPLPKVQEESSSNTDESAKDSASVNFDDSEVVCKLCQTQKVAGEAVRPRSLSLPSKKEHLEQLRHLNHVVSQSSTRFCHLRHDRDASHSRKVCRTSSLNRERKLSDLPNIQESGDFSDDLVLNKIVAEEVEKLHNFRFTCCSRRYSCPLQRQKTEHSESDSETEESVDSDVRCQKSARERRSGFRGARTLSAPSAVP